MKNIWKIIISIIIGMLLGLILMTFSNYDGIDSYTLFHQRMNERCRAEMFN